MVLQSSNTAFALDNGSNMSGKYSGLQARIWERNPLADYIPCFAHSLNLVCCFKVHWIRERLMLFQCINSSVGALRGDNT